MNPDLGHEEAKRQDPWSFSETNGDVALIQWELLQRIWSPSTPQTVLDVGCGRGEHVEWLAQPGHQVTGVDTSPTLLASARERLSRCVHLELGSPEDLPFENNTFDTVSLIRTLERVENPEKALAEAVRVARHHVLIGALNKYSPLLWPQYVKQIWNPSRALHGPLYSVFQLRDLAARALSGPPPVRWGTCLVFPFCALRYLSPIERSPFFQWQPFGSFIALRIDLCYSLRTVQQPLFSSLPYGARQTSLKTCCHLDPTAPSRCCAECRRLEQSVSSTTPEASIHPSV